MIAVSIRTYATGDVEIFIPRGYSNYDGEDLTDFLDRYPDDIEYIKSDRED